MCQKADFHNIALTMQCECIFFFSGVVNIYLKNATEERRGFKKTESYTETKCTGPKKKKDTIGIAEGRTVGNYLQVIYKRASL